MLARQHGSSVPNPSISLAVHQKLEYKLVAQVEEDPADRDASVRAEAVNSLASVAHELFHTPEHPSAEPSKHIPSSDGSQQQRQHAASANGDLHTSSSGQHHAGAGPASTVDVSGESVGQAESASEALRQDVCAPLLAAMGDYSTDNRWA